MPIDEPLYPVNLRVAGRRCLVVGAGAVAAEKARGLLDCGALVDVVAPEVSDEMAALGVALDRRPYARGDVAGYRLVVTATDDPAVNRAVYEDAEAAGIWVNAADDPVNCSYTLPSRVRRGSLLIAVSTGGRSPALARWIRRQLEAEFGPEYEALLDLLAEVRGGAGATDPAAWQNALDAGMLELVREGRADEARDLLNSCLSSPSG